ncbi:STM4012 family radical SAM protein [Rhizohabitans arisaemae]|uniref:STM4012 family radical SAM protein n=1 Tax=Rhizohabitans arisaemae TaxID=2720610 RepID=UPI0024B094F8|nr:STM4012 family radical SAM protein [Rhizohabitans arisaemae]
MSSPYQGYVYAYPHKSAYRPLNPRPRLADLWAEEKRNSLFLYVHIPFCEMRCGFCNLFTRTGAPEELVGAYLDALDRQALAVQDALGPARFALGAIGGGTPTYLSPAELDRLYGIVERFTDPRAVPFSVETSPATATPDRLGVLADRGVHRISIGVQSFVDAEARAAIRPQRRAEVEKALRHIRDSGVPVLNIDLIYGIDGQTPETWRYSLDAALAWEPEEIYLYPLYVRPLTGLARTAREWDDQRLTLYRRGRDHLLAAGYEQTSMRMFRRIRHEPTAYSCQGDGMVGLGCGARSYTGGLHYSFDYAVDARQVRAIVDDFVRQPAFDHAEVGYRLDEEDRRRRYLIQSLLQAEGVETAAYRELFGREARTDLWEFTATGWIEPATGTTEDRVRLTPEGLAHSDAIGPALFSPRVAALMTAHEAR